MDAMTKGNSMRLIALALVSAIALGACATQPKPCTAEWFNWKTSRFFEDFAKGHRSDLDSLRETTSRLQGADVKSMSNIATMAAAGVKVVALAGNFLSDTVPEIQDAYGQCGSAPGAATLFADLLRREGFDERAVKAIEDFGVFLDKRPT